MIYLDYQATTPVDPAVLAAMVPYFTEQFGNAASRQHRLGWVASEAVEDARKAVARLIGATAKEIVFTSGATEANNLALKGLAEVRPDGRDQIVSVVTEHKSVLDTCQRLESFGCRTTKLPVEGDGTVDLDTLRAAVSEKTFAVSVMAANNEIGILAPLKEIAEIAHAKGVSITFMAKPDMNEAGSSFHLHSSLWDATGTRNVFDEQGSPTGSRLFRHWVAGQMALAREFSYFYAPYVNSYKRYQAGTFAPTRIAWSWDNRTTGLRVCGHGASLRLENRIPGADANPYLAFAMTIAAGLHGIERQLEPPPLYQGDAYQDGRLPQVPTSMREAVAELERSAVAREVLGDAVYEHYCHTARLELEAYDRLVSSAELARNFERI